LQDISTIVSDSIKESNNLQRRIYYEGKTRTQTCSLP
jgi:hypothetical protein